MNVIAITYIEDFLRFSKDKSILLLVLGILLVIHNILNDEDIYIYQINETTFK